MLSCWNSWCEIFAGCVCDLRTSIVVIIPLQYYVCVCVCECLYIIIVSCWDSSQYNSCVLNWWNIWCEVCAISRVCMWRAYTSTQSFWVRVRICMSMSDLEAGPLETPQLVWLYSTTYVCTYIWGVMVPTYRCTDDWWMDGDWWMGDVCVCWWWWCEYVRCWNVVHWFVAVH